jgi:hypothetical protein
MENGTLIGWALMNGRAATMGITGPGFTVLQKEKAK